MLWLVGFALLGPQAGKGEPEALRPLTTFDVCPRRQLCCPALRHDRSPGKDYRIDFAGLAGWANTSSSICGGQVLCGWAMIEELNFADEPVIEPQPIGPDSSLPQALPRPARCGLDERPARTQFHRAGDGYGGCGG